MFCYANRHKPLVELVLVVGFGKRSKLIVFFGGELYGNTTKIPCRLNSLQIHAQEFVFVFATNLMIYHLLGPRLNEVKKNYNDLDQALCKIFMQVIG